MKGTATKGWWSGTPCFEYAMPMVLYTVLDLAGSTVRPIPARLTIYQDLTTTGIQSDRVCSNDCSSILATTTSIPFSDFAPPSQHSTGEDSFHEWGDSARTGGQNGTISNRRKTQNRLA